LRSPPLVRGGSNVDEVAGLSTEKPSAADFKSGGKRKREGPGQDSLVAAETEEDGNVLKSNEGSSIGGTSRRRAIETLMYGHA